MFGLKINKYDFFYPLEVVGRGSETQLQEGQNLNDVIQRYNGEATLKEWETKIGMNNQSTKSV